MWTGARLLTAGMSAHQPHFESSSNFRKLGIDPDKMLYTPQGRPSHLVSDPTPIAEVC